MTVATNTSPWYELALLLLINLSLNLALYLFSPVLYLHNTTLIGIVLIGAYLVYLYRATGRGLIRRYTALYVVLACMCCFLISALCLIAIINFVDHGLVDDYIASEMESLAYEAAHMKKRGMQVAINYRNEAAELRAYYEPGNVLQRSIWQSSLLAIIAFFFSPSNRTI